MTTTEKNQNWKNIQIQKKKRKRRRLSEPIKSETSKFDSSEINQLISSLLDHNQYLLQTNHELVSQFLTRNEYKLLVSYSLN